MSLRFRDGAPGAGSALSVHASGPGLRSPPELNRGEEARSRFSDKAQARAALWHSRPVVRIPVCAGRGVPSPSGGGLVGSSAGCSWHCSHPVDRVAYRQDDRDGVWELLTARSRQVVVEPKAFMLWSKTTNRYRGRGRPNTYTMLPRPWGGCWARLATTSASSSGRA
jgi:hypothetical protein